MSHQCPVVGCTWSVSNDRLMCLAHWKLVPLALQTKVSSTWRNLRQAQKRPGNLQDRLTAYQAARNAAIDSVNRLGPLV